MSGRQQRKIDNSFLEIKQAFIKWEENKEDPYIAEKEIRLLIEKISNMQTTIKKSDSHLYEENEIKLIKIKKKFILLSENLYEDVSKKYLIDITYNDLIKGNDETLLRYGVVGLLKKEKFIEQAFHKYFDNNTPDHPKDEYPLARSSKRKFVIHTGPTNSGKTYDSLVKLKNSHSGMYLAPLRLLALEIYEKLNVDGTPCALTTGDEEIEVPFSRHISCTIEKADLEHFYELVVIDESQLAGDNFRGAAWTRAILGLYAQEIHICCSLNAVTVINKLIKDCGDSIEIVINERKTPLIMEDIEFKFPRDVRAGDALIVFSRKMVLKTASALSEYNIKSSLIYGNLPPDTRRKQVSLFAEGINEVVVSTDAIGMGLNLPIKRVVLMETEKYDGDEQRILTDQEVKQIAGRAGRKGIYPVGYVNVINDKERIIQQLYKFDEELTKVYIGPTKNTILKIRIGTLKEKLMYWKSFGSKVSYIEKTDIEEQLYLLDSLNKNLETSLSEEELYRAIHIPFDYKNEKLLYKWQNYLREAASNIDEHTKPIINLNAELEDLELMYREVDLYYSFSKAYNKKIDNQWVQEKRELISEQIHFILNEGLLKEGKHCSRCLQPVPLNSAFNKCDECFQKENK
ncbi:helicase-related protein [Priestia aryabhattai]